MPSSIFAPELAVSAGELGTDGGQLPCRACCYCRERAMEFKGAFEMAKGMVMENR